MLPNVNLNNFFKSATLAISHINAHKIIKINHFPRWLFFLKPKINTIWFKGLQKVPKIETGEMVQSVRDWGRPIGSGALIGPQPSQIHKLQSQ